MLSFFLKVKLIIRKKKNLRKPHKFVSLGVPH